MITATRSSATFGETGLARRGSLEAPFVSVIVPVYNNREGVEQLLGLLERQTYPADRFECLLIDNASDPPLELTGQPAFDCRILREEQPGSYVARNRGVAAAKGVIFAFTDSDCLPAEDWLRQGVDALETFDRPGMVGGRIQIVCRDENRPSAFELLNAICGFPQEEYVVEKHFAATANMICHRELFDRVGLFDASLYSGGDYHWGSRVHAAGFSQKYLAECRVAHPALANFHQFWKKYRRIAGGFFQVRRREGWSMPRILSHALVGSARRWSLSQRDVRCRTWSDLLRLTYSNAALGAMLTYEFVRLWCGGSPRRD